MIITKTADGYKIFGKPGKHRDSGIFIYFYKSHTRIYIPGKYRKRLENVFKDKDIFPRQQAAPYIYFELNLTKKEEAYARAICLGVRPKDALRHFLKYERNKKKK